MLQKAKDNKMSKSKHIESQLLATIKTATITNKRGERANIQSQTMNK